MTGDAIDAARPRLPVGAALTDGATLGARPAMAWTAVGAVAIVKLAVTLWSIRQYGIFRDELYYVACARHFDWGYVDHPALSILILWPIVHVLGTSLVAIRIVPAIVGVLTIVLVAALAREMGGRAMAQGLAATAALIAPDFLGVAHVYSMNVFDVAWWALTAWFVARLVRTGDARWWIAIGAALGAGLANKISVLWLGAGLCAGMLLTDQRRSLGARWIWIAAALAAAGGLPYALWNTAHQWPTLEFIHNATTQKMAPVSLSGFVKGQFDSMHLFNLPIAAAGLVYLFVHRDGRRFRILGWTFVVVAAILLANGTSRSGYLSPAYTWVLAAGAVAMEVAVTRWRPMARRAAVASTVGLLLVGGAIVAPFALPLLPVERYERYARSLGVMPSTEEKKTVGQLPQEYADMFGWHEIVGTVATVVRSLPPDERPRARVLAFDYGVAGAIDLFGPDLGVPPAISGHNNYWFWGPDGYDGTAPLIIVGATRKGLEARFTDVTQAATIDCGLCMPYENGLPVWIARGPNVTIASFWPRLKHYD